MSYTVGEKRREGEGASLCVKNRTKLHLRLGLSLRLGLGLWPTNTIKSLLGLLKDSSLKRVKYNTYIKHQNWEKIHKKLKTTCPMTFVIHPVCGAFHTVFVFQYMLECINFIPQK